MATAAEAKSKSSKEKNHYEELNLERKGNDVFYKDAEGKEHSGDTAVKKAYRARALETHPDKSDKPKEIAEEEFKKVGKAFDELNTPEKRAAYDRKLKEEEQEAKKSKEAPKEKAKPEQQAKPEQAKPTESKTKEERDARAKTKTNESEPDESSPQSPAEKSRRRSETGYTKFNGVRFDLKNEQPKASPSTDPTDKILIEIYLRSVFNNMGAPGPSVYGNKPERIFFDDERSNLPFANLIEILKNLSNRGNEPLFKDKDETVIYIVLNKEGKNSEETVENMLIQLLLQKVLLNTEAEVKKELGHGFQQKGQEQDMSGRRNPS